MERSEILELTVPLLKIKLTELGLPITGRKATLQDRLFEHFGLNIEEDEEEDEEEEIQIENEAIRAAEIGQEEVNKAEEEVEAIYGEVDSNVPYSGSHTIFTLRDIQESLNYFDGIGHPEVEAWINEFEENAFSVKWNDLQKFIYAKQLIKGAAPAFIKSQSINGWAHLKRSLREEFGKKLSSVEIHKSLQNRKKKNNESFLEYLYSLIAISKSINLDEQSIIEYFIEGINDNKQSKSMLYEATTIQELKLKIKTYEKVKTKFYNSTEIRHNNPTRAQKRCTNCPHLNNHYTSECKKGVCFICNQRGHKAFECKSNMQKDNQVSNYKTNFQNQSNQTNYKNQTNNVNFPNNQNPPNRPN